LLTVVDTHAHLEEIEGLDQVLNDAAKVGVKGIIAMGSGEKSNLRVMEIHHQYPLLVYPALGLHPCDLGNMNAARIDSTLSLIEANTNSAIAIGEIGLDYDKRAIKTASKSLQKDVLVRLLALAKEYRKPVSLHSRYAWKDCFDMVKSAGIECAVFHWFTGTPEVLKEILDAGYFISCTPAAEYHEDHRTAVRETPLEQLLLETDCPVTYGRDTRYRSQPADILRSLKAVSELKGVPEAVIAQKTTDNAAGLFGIYLDNQAVVF
jgi:TatD DNase family protein